MTRRALRFAPIVLALLVPACGSSASSSTSPSTTGLTTDTFSGTVAVGSSDFKNFTVTVTGEVDVTLTVAPLPMMLAVGVPGASGCVAIAGSANLATPGTSVQVAGELTPGTFCVLVSATPSQTAAAAYTVTVVHP